MYKETFWTVLNLVKNKKRKKEMKDKKRKEKYQWDWSTVSESPCTFLARGILRVTV